MSQYVVLIEKAKHNYSAYAPGVPGCAAVGDTVEETIASMQEALTFHFEGLLADGDPIPAPATIAATVDVPLPTVPA